MSGAVLDGRTEHALRVAVVCADRGVTATGRSGASEHLRRISEGFRAAGAEVELWCRRLAPLDGQSAVPVPSGIDALEAPRAALSESLRGAVGPRRAGEKRRVRGWLLSQAQRLDHGIDGVTMGRWVQSQARRFRPDLVYERFSLSSSPGLAAARELGVPWVVELNAPLAWEEALFRGSRPRRSLLKRESRVLTAADALICVSSELRDYALLRGADPSRVHVVANGAPSTAFDSLQHQAPVSEPNPAMQPYVLGYAGSFRPWHGLSVSLVALRGLAAQLAPRPLLLDMWGDGPERGTFATMILAEPGLDATFHGWGSAEQLARARSFWDAAWVPQAEWPPQFTDSGRPVAELVTAFGEDVPARYFCPLKEAEAAAQGIPTWTGVADAPPVLNARPRAWSQVAEEILALSGFTPSVASWDDGSRSEGASNPSP